MEKKNTRIGGYAVTIHGFIQVPTNDLTQQIASATAVKKAIDENDVAALVAMMKIDEGGVSQKLVNRLVPISSSPTPAPPQTDTSHASQATLDGATGSLRQRRTTAA